MLCATYGLLGLSKPAELLFVVTKRKKMLIFWAVASGSNFPWPIVRDRRPADQTDRGIEGNRNMQRDREGREVSNGTSQSATVLRKNEREA